MFDYSRLVETAARLMSRFGKTMILRRATKGVYDPVNNTRSTSSTDDYSFTGVVTDYSEHEINGQSILAGDKILMCSPLSVVPTTTDLVIDGSTIWKIINVYVVQPANSIVYYRIQVRR